MKYGLLYYKDTENLGDDVQSYASKRFLPRIDYMIDRENLDSFIPNEKEYVATIMNGWYMDYKFNWPPSPYIYPHLISMHFSPYNKIVNVGYPHLNGYGLEYFKKFDKIGCRDIYTKELLAELGLNSYLSGCMTLTLERLPNIEKQDYILLLDINNEIEEYIRKSTPKEIKTFSNVINSNEHRNLSWDEREKKVKEYLTLLQKASLVITPRLHCALPCLAVETPVLLVNYKTHDDRLGTFLDFLYYITEEDLLNGKSKYDINNPSPNKSTYLEMRKALENSCINFINSCENTTDTSLLPDLVIYKEIINRSNFQKSIAMKHINTLQKMYKEVADYNKELVEARDYFKKQAENLASSTKNIDEISTEKLRLENEINELKAILSSRKAMLKKILKNGKTF